MSDPVDLDLPFLQNAGQHLADARRRCPVQPVTSRYGDAWLVTRYADVMNLLTDPRLIQDPRTAAQVGHADRDVPVDDPATQLAVNNMLYTDRPGHTRLRRVASKAFTPGAIARLRPMIEDFVTERLDELETVEQTDLIAAFCTPIPLFVISEILGIPEQDRAQFVSWAHDTNNITSAEAYRAATLASGEYLRKLIAAKRAEPTSDILSDLVAIADQEDGMTEQELVSTAWLLVFAGSDTTVGLIANSVIALLSAPDQLALFRAHPDVAVSALDELLRHGSPVNIPAVRYAAEPMTIGGATINPGEKVFLSLMSANQDDDQFNEPNKLDLNRRASGHLAFGRGIHYCVGAPLARLETSIALAMLFERFPAMRLAADPATLPKRDSLLVNTVTELPVCPRG